MKYFLRSLQYLKPYRTRLTVAVVCTVIIAVLWGGGLAMMLPAMKILISDEGFHGWAWNSMAEDRLGTRVVQQRVPAGMRMDDQDLSMVLSVVDTLEGSPADRAGIRAGDWIVGIGTGDANATPVRGDVLARRIALTEANRTLALRIYRPDGNRRGPPVSRVIDVKLGRLGFKADTLGWLATRIHEPASRSGRFPLLLGVLAVGLAVTYLRDILRFTQEYLVNTAVWQGIMDVRCDNYNVVLRLPTTFFSEKGVTDTMSRFVQDTGELARGQQTLFGKTLVEPAKAIASIVLAMIFSWQLTLLAMIAGPPAYVLIRKFGKIMKRASRRALESWSAMLAVLEETLTGMRVVKAYTMESAERKRFFHVNRRLVKQQRRMSRIDAATSPAVEALGLTAAMGAVALAGYWVLNNELDPQVFIALMACLAAMFDPVRKLAKVATRFQRADAAAKRIFDLQDTPQEVRRQKAPKLPRHSQSIRFRNICFRYPNAEDDALRYVNLDIEHGQTVAIVGPNGCGKTTLVSLLPRLIDPSEGTILVDGRDITDHSLRSLRSQIGLVTQDTVLFHATIRENIAYGKRRAGDEEVLSAAKKAFVDEFVQQMPDGYDSIVGEHGATLSGGQKQRISIARAILRDPAILIFDEATSQVDPDSERRIHQAMEEFMTERTTMMIAHRFQTVMAADQIVVMNAGQIEASGTHKELLATCELYRHLYKTQFVEADEEDEVDASATSATGEDASAES
jgi:ABC-type multidrug transport system fused ATPase/permease subunit